MILRTLALYVPAVFNALAAASIVSCIYLLAHGVSS